MCSSSCLLWLKYQLHVHNRKVREELNIGRLFISNESACNLELEHLCVFLELEITRSGSRPVLLLGRKFFLWMPAFVFELKRTNRSASAELSAFLPRLLCPLFSLLLCSCWQWVEALLAGGTSCRECVLLLKRPCNINLHQHLPPALCFAEESFVEADRAEDEGLEVAASLFFKSVGGSCQDLLVFLSRLSCLLVLHLTTYELGRFVHGVDFNLSFWRQTLR